MKRSPSRNSNEQIGRPSRKPVVTLYERYVELLRLRKQIKLLSKIDAQRRRQA